MEDIAESYVNEIANDPDFIRLKELKKEIDQKYGLLIISFKTKESLYNDALGRPEVYDLKKAQRELMESKSKLYSKEEVKEYFTLERKINEKLNKDMNSLMESISLNLIKHK